jgi:hypothetical protein
MKDARLPAAYSFFSYTAHLSPDDKLISPFAETVLIPRPDFYPDKDLRTDRILFNNNGC